MFKFLLYIFLSIIAVIFCISLFFGIVDILVAIGLGLFFARLAAAFILFMLIRMCFIAYMEAT